MSINTSLAGTSTGTVEKSAALVLVGRALLSAMFIFAGFGKLTSISATAAWFGSLGLPMPIVVTVLVGLLELFGGLAVLTGFKTRIAAFALAIFTLAATAVAHLDFADQVQLLFFQKNLAVAGGLFVLSMFGAGALSVDAKRG
jgi:putative oxidoreductase